MCQDIDFLKIDVESNEFSAVPHFVKDSRFPSFGVKLIMIEFHFYEMWGVSIH